jgi:hypothetical protein
MGEILRGSTDGPAEEEGIKAIHSIAGLKQGDDAIALIHEFLDQDLLSFTTLPLMILDDLPEVIRIPIRGQTQIAERRSAG